MSIFSGWVLSLLLKNPGIELQLGEIVNPASVSLLAQEIGGSSDKDFTLRAWDWVAREIDYWSQSTDLKLKDDSIICSQNCQLLSETQFKRKANCFGSSVLLVSLLRNRLPPDRVYMTIGILAKNGSGGHAWVTVNIDDTWFVLESTLDQLPAQPWVTEEALKSIYIPEAYFNDQEITCRPGAELCIKIRPCLPCLQHEGIWN